MTDTLINLPLGEKSSLVQTCRKNHQAWATTIVQNEQEINQLLGLLVGVLEQHTYQNLHCQAIYYHGDLKRLKTRFQRLRLDMICERACNQQPDCKPRIGLYSTMAIDTQLQTLTEELGQIKTGCHQLVAAAVN